MSSRIHRSVHLDFHTSPDIENIGSRFDKKQFQQALLKGKLESITVFAKCHHGLCYYPTNVGTMHKHLSFDLTGAMVDAAHEIGVRAPIYITAGWSDLDSTNHPEWAAVKRPAEKVAEHTDASPRPFTSWTKMCLNDGEYCKHIYELTREICDRYETVDGLFYDICLDERACYCPECIKGMTEMGLDPDSDGDARRYYVEKHQSFMSKCYAILREKHPDATIFFNSGGANIFLPEFQAYSTHYEMEDLPTFWGGYDKLPLNAKYFSHKGKNYIGMTGKFHLDWGEFGGFKPKEALRYETASMAMWGAGCSVGDHVHPDCEMEAQTYENIGFAYDYAEKIGQFCFDGETVTDLGIYLPSTADAGYGLSDILLENQIDFDVVYEDDYSKFSTVIFPEGVTLSDSSLVALKEFIARGGKVIFCADSLIKDGSFQIDCGAEYIGQPIYDCDYLLTDNSRGFDLPMAPMLCYQPAQRIKATDGEVIAKVIPPYFNRTYGHFCGHKNTPHNKDAEPAPAIVRKGNIVYIAHPLATNYRTNGSIFHKRYFMLALRSVYSSESFKVRGMASQGRCSMIAQPQHNRYCINAMYASPLKHGAAEIIDDIMPVYNIEFTVNVPLKIKRVYLGLSGQELPFSLNGKTVSFTLPKLECHEAIVLEY